MKTDAAAGFMNLWRNCAELRVARKPQAMNNQKMDKRWTKDRLGGRITSGARPIG
jgi:hypothetical protein